MANKTYSEKLKDPRWQKKRLKILDRDNWACTLCGDTETTLDVHHKSYNGDPWESEDSELTTVCRHCHLGTEILKNYTEYPEKSVKFISEDESLSVVAFKINDHVHFADLNKKDTWHCMSKNAINSLHKLIHNG